MAAAEHPGPEHGNLLQAPWPVGGNKGIEPTARNKSSMADFCALEVDPANRARVRVPSHPLLHQGMNFLLWLGDNACVDPDPNDGVPGPDFEAGVLDANPNTGDLVLDTALPHNLERYQYKVSCRVHPKDWQQWAPLDVICSVKEVHEHLTTRVRMGVLEDMLDMMSTDDIPLSVDVVMTAPSIKDLDVAWTEQRRWLEKIRTLGVEMGLIGPRAKDKQLTMQMRTIIHGMKAMYEALYALFIMKQAQQGQPQDQGGSDPAVSPWWLSTAPATVATKKDGSPELGTTQLVEFFLARAFRDNIRKNVQGVVFEEVMTSVTAAVTQADWPPCQEPEFFQMEEDPGRPYVVEDWNDAHGQPVWLASGERRQRKRALCGEPACYGTHKGGEGASMDEPGGYRPMRYRTDCYCDLHRRPDMVDVRFDEDGNPFRMCATTVLTGTKAWRPRISPHSGRAMVLEEWMETVLDRTANYDMWAAMMSNYGAYKSSCHKALLFSTDGCIGFVSRNPVWYSFRNGVYNIVSNVFLPYGDPAIPSDLCTANFIDQRLEPEWTQMETHELVVEGYDAILDCQQYSPDMKEWIDVFFGRLFFPLGVYDKWEKLMIIKGFAATGKSTIAKAIASLIGEENVGYIASNCEEQWALANVADKAIWMCLELKSGFRLPTGTMQSMVSGENVVVNEKYKTAYTMAWKQPGLLVGNELPVSWSQDVANALARRILPFPFDIAPSTQDAGLAPRLMGDMSKMFVRMTRRYMLRARTLGRAALDPHLPPELRASMTDFAKLSSPLRTMLETGAGDEYMMASPEEKIMIMWEIAIAQRMPKCLGLNGSELKKLRQDYANLVRTNQIDNGNGEGGVAFEDEDPLNPGTLMAPADVRPSMGLLHAFNVSPAEIGKSLKAYCISNNIRSTIDVNNRDNYIAASRAMQTPVASSVKVKDGDKVVTIPGKRWYGLRRNDNNNNMPFNNSFLTEKLSEKAALDAYHAVCSQHHS